MPKREAGARRPLPQAKEPMGPDALRDVRIVDLSWIVAGPTCTRVLADFGAQVIKVEYEGAPDYIRGSPPFVEDQPGVNRSGFFNNLNRNKLGITLNVRHPRGMELLRELIAISDVVVENFSSRVMEERWGLGYEEQRKLRPDIIYCALSGFGHSGRHRDYTTWGPTAQAHSGVTFMSGLPDHEPAGWGFSYMDHTAGYQAAIAILMALHHRQRTGQGQWIDLSQVEGGVAITGTAILDYAVNGRPYRRVGDRADHPQVAPHNAYRCLGQVIVGEGQHDGRWCVIACFNEEQWCALCRVIGEPHLATDPRFATNADRLRHQDELDVLIEGWTRTLPPREVMERCQQAGVPSGMVQNARDKVGDDPQLRARGFFPEVDHPEIGRFKYEGVPAKLSVTPGKVLRSSPVLGQHNEYIYREVLGFGAEELEQMMVEGVI
ncbi:MAG: CoA transferase [Chloroflexi bacterium]|nr:CoA transferase [Chloroflexota bacterium]